MLRSLSWDPVIKTESKLGPSTERIYYRELVAGVRILELLILMWGWERMVK